MSGLERLTEALADADYRLEQANSISPPYHDETLYVLVQAARRYADLLANGQEVEWCEEHAVSTPHGKSYCWLKVIDRKLGEEETPCRIVSMRLSLYPKEAENG